MEFLFFWILRILGDGKRVGRVSFVSCYLLYSFVVIIRLVGIIVVVWGLLVKVVGGG